jgi:hypothetical protein
MRPIILLVILFLTMHSYSNGQSTEDSVKKAVNLLFEGMMKSDTSLLRQAFADSAILQTIGTAKDGNTFIRNESIDGFAEAIGKTAPGAADERIVIQTIKVDGALAIVWAPYKFYYKGQFSHCGVDSFQLVRIKGVWKIQYLIDTRRKDGCG